MVIGINNGLTMGAIMQMTVGQVVDFAVEKYNSEHAGEGKKANKRKATQADFDAFFG